MATYTCAVCEGTYTESEVMSTKCSECNKTICIYCTEFDPVANVDVCDKCADDGMFNSGSEIVFATKQKLKAK